MPTPTSPSTWSRTFALSLVSLVCFAGNSVLARLALETQRADAATFSTVRLASGALTLLLVARTTRPMATLPRMSLRHAAALALYAIPFSFAYLRLTTGTGALILFGAVQLTMLGQAFRLGERLRLHQGFGFLLALAGLVYLLRPGLSTPSLGSAALMALAGCAWGVYSLLGRTEGDPLLRTAGNFMASIPLALAVSALTLQSAHANATGLVLAVISGSVTSGLGYAAWFAALRGLTATRAAVVQLAVPVLATLGGVLFLGEGVTIRLAVATSLVLTGVALGVLGGVDNAGARARRPR